MDELTSRAVVFFAANMPSWRLLAFGGPPALLWPYLCLRLAGYLKTQCGWRTGYTRKVFHFLIFGSVAAIQAAAGTRTVCLLGLATSLVVFGAIAHGAGNPLYEAIAREKDAPHRTYFVLAPYFATLIGGLASNILFGWAAVLGYLITGLGDAVGEPVGTRYGRHPYRVPSLTGVTSTRSIEGSVAVFAACFAGGLIAVALMPQVRLTGAAVAWAAVIAGASAALEAISPHGWDNAVLQVAPAGMAWLIWGGAG